jgi:hypothetical protein
VRRKKRVQSLTEDERLSNMCANAGEHFGDYLIVVRVKGGMIWQSSDDTWSMGAMQRYMTRKVTENQRSDRKDDG